MRRVIAIPRDLVARDVGAGTVDVEIYWDHFQKTISRVSERASALAADQIAGAGHHGAGGDPGHGFQKIATLHVMLQTPEGNDVAELRKVCAKT